MTPSSSPDSLLTSPSASSTFSDISVLSLPPLPSPSTSTAPTKTSAFFATRPPSPSHVDLVAPDTHVLPILLHRLFPSRYQINDDDPADLRKSAVLDPDSTPRPPAVVPAIQSIESAEFDSATLPTLAPGYTLCSQGPTFHTTLVLIRALGQGAFSSVWLAQDASSPPLDPSAHRIDPHPIGGYVPGTTPVRHLVRDTPRPPDLPDGIPSSPPTSSLSRSSLAIATSTAPVLDSFAKSRFFVYVSHHPFTLSPPLTSKSTAHRPPKYHHPTRRLHHPYPPCSSSPTSQAATYSRL